MVLGAVHLPLVLVLFRSLKTPMASNSLSAEKRHKTTMASKQKS